MQVKMETIIDIMNSNEDKKDVIEGDELSRFPIVLQNEQQQTGLTEQEQFGLIFFFTWPFVFLLLLFVVAPITLTIFLIVWTTVAII